ncbi:MAG: hypothetical protein WBG80_03060 [Bacteroidota bacterium]
MVILWVPTILFVYLILGSLETDAVGELIYRINLRGLVSSVCILGAAVFVSRGERGPFVVGIVLWVLALAALLLEPTTLLVIHF